MAEVLGVEVGPDEPLCLAEFLLAKADVWDAIVSKHGLRPLSMEQLLGRIPLLRRLLLCLRCYRSPSARLREHGQDQAGWLHRDLGHRVLRPLVQDPSGSKVLPPAS